MDVRRQYKTIEIILAILTNVWSFLILIELLDHLRIIHYHLYVADVNINISITNTLIVFLN